MNDSKYREIADEIIDHPEFKKLKDESHHLICTRYDHVLTVSHYTYQLARLFRMDVKSATRAALLHDFFHNPTDNKYDVKTLVNHPELALNKSKEHFVLNEVEANAIASHMFPAGKLVPSYKESWLLTIVDKFVAIGEYGYTFRKTAQVAMVCFLCL